MTTNQNDAQSPVSFPGRQVWEELQHAQPQPVTVQIAGRSLLDQGRDAERAQWTEKAQHIPGLVHQLTGPEAGMPAEIERWESWHLAYVQRLASELQYLATTAASTIARRDGAL